MQLFSADVTIFLNFFGEFLFAPKNIKNCPQKLLIILNDEKDKYISSLFNNVITLS